MIAKPTPKLLVTLLVLLIATPIISVGCEGAQPPAASSPGKLSSPGELSSTLVPNTQLDIYACAKQDSPTTIPVWMVGEPNDIEVESAALWGVPAGDEFALGMGLTLTNARDASELYAEINLEEDGWQMLSGDTIFLVHGSGAAAESLKTAISNRDFKYCDDSDLLEAEATLPCSGTTMPAAIALVKPSEALTGFVAEYADLGDLDQINMILKLVDPEVITVGLYSPHQIDITEMMEIMASGGSIFNLDVGLLALVESGFPGFLVEPVIGKYLTESEFTEVNFGEFMLYKKSLSSDDGEVISLLVWVKGNRAFAALAAQESYAQGLMSATIANVNR